MVVMMNPSQNEDKNLTHQDTIPIKNKLIVRTDTSYGSPYSFVRISLWKKFDLLENVRQRAAKNIGE
jgi:hypothetical protein